MDITMTSFMDPDTPHDYRAFLLLPILFSLPNIISFFATDTVKSFLSSINLSVVLLLLLLACSTFGLVTRQRVLSHFAAEITAKHQAAFDQGVKNAKREIITAVRAGTPWTFERSLCWNTFEREAFNLCNRLSLPIPATPSTVMDLSCAVFRACETEIRNVRNAVSQLRRDTDAIMTQQCADLWTAKVLLRTTRSELQEATDNSIHRMGQLQKSEEDLQQRLSDSEIIVKDLKRQLTSSCLSENELRKTLGDTRLSEQDLRRQLEESQEHGRKLESAMRRKERNSSLVEKSLRQEIKRQNDKVSLLRQGKESLTRELDDRRSNANKVPIMEAEIKSLKTKPATRSIGTQIDPESVGMATAAAEGHGGVDPPSSPKLDSDAAAKPDTEHEGAPNPTAQNNRPSQTDASTQTPSQAEDKPDVESMGEALQVEATGSTLSGLEEPKSDQPLSAEKESGHPKDDLPVELSSDPEEPQNDASMLEKPASNTEKDDTPVQGEPRLQGPAISGSVKDPQAFDVLKADPASPVPKGNAEVQQGEKSAPEPKQDVDALKIDLAKADITSVATSGSDAVTDDGTRQKAPATEALEVQGGKEPSSTNGERLHSAGSSQASPGKNTASDLVPAMEVKNDKGPSNAGDNISTRGMPATETQEVGTDKGPSSEDGKRSTTVGAGNTDVSDPEAVEPHDGAPDVVMGEASPGTTGVPPVIPNMSGRSGGVDRDPDKMDIVKSQTVELPPSREVEMGRDEPDQAPSHIFFAPRPPAFTQLQRPIMQPQRPIAQPSKNWIGAEPRMGRGEFGRGTGSSALSRQPKLPPRPAEWLLNAKSDAQKPPASIPEEKGKAKAKPIPTVQPQSKSSSSREDPVDEEEKRVAALRRVVSRPVNPATLPESNRSLLNQYDIQRRREEELRAFDEFRAAARTRAEGKKTAAAAKKAADKAKAMAVRKAEMAAQTAWLEAAMEKDRIEKTKNVKTRKGPDEEDWEKETFNFQF